MLNDSVVPSLTVEFLSPIENALPTDGLGTKFYHITYDHYNEGKLGEMWRCFEPPFHRVQDHKADVLHDVVLGKRLKTQLP